MGPHVGDPVRVVMTKWGDRPHWEHDAAFLGSDDLGDWVGAPAGTHHARPGMAFDSEVDSVTLLPAPDAVDRGWAATFYAPGIWTDTYVDITTPPVWDDSGGSWVARAVDLDLDVIRRPGGEVFLDDEDEFEEHQVSLGYPPELVAATVASARVVLDLVRTSATPFDGSAAPWLARVVEQRRPAPSVVEQRRPSGA